MNPLADVLVGERAGLETIFGAGFSQVSTNNFPEK